MFENDSTYRGQGLSPDFYFKSPIAELEENEDEFNRHIVHLSDDAKSYWATEIKKMNDEYGLGLPVSDELTSYENPDYLWLSFSLENMRRNIIMQYIISLQESMQTVFLPYRTFSSC